MNSRRSITIADLWRPESQDVEKNIQFLWFLEKRSLTGEFSKFYVLLTYLITYLLTY